jgi:RNA polymerase sigma-70 factor (ECF subfamily)
MPDAADETDQALLARFRGGEPEAFAQIVARYGGLVYSCCHRVTGDAQRSEDLTQETFFKLSRRPEEVTRSLPAWLHRVATRGAIDALRRGAARRRYERAAGAEQSRQAAQADPAADAEALSWAEAGPWVDEALAELPEDVAEAITRHYLLGQPQRELAKALGVSQATVSRRIARGLEALQTALRGKGLAVGSAAGLSALLMGAPAHAAPASLTQAAGKMALLQSASAGVSGGAAWWSSVTLMHGVAAGVVLAAAVGSGVALVRWASIDPRPASPMAVSTPGATAGNNAAHRPEPGPGDGAPQDDDAPREIVYLPLDGAAGFATTYLIAIEAPTGNPDATLQAVYADGHVATITERAAERHIEAQTGRPMAEVLRDAPRAPLGGL